MGEVHATFAWVAIGINGTVSLVCFAYSITKRPIDLVFRSVVSIAVVAMLTQVGLGLARFGQGIEPGSIHMFYGFVILFTFTFVYIYRIQFEKRPALGWGLVLLFTMGLGLRAVINFAESF